MKLTDQERVVFKEMIQYAPVGDLLTILWWGLVNQGKQRELMYWLMAGMAWKFAMRNARNYG